MKTKSSSIWNALFWVFMGLIFSALSISDLINYLETGTIHIVQKNFHVKGELAHIANIGTLIIGINLIYIGVSGFFCKNTNDK